MNRLDRVRNECIRDTAQVEGDETGLVWRDAEYKGGGGGAEDGARRKRGRARMRFTDVVREDREEEEKDERIVCITNKSVNGIKY